MLKETLKTLLQRLNSERLIQNCLTWHPQSSNEIVDKIYFVHLFRHEHQSLTLDQIRNIETLLNTNWMKERQDSIDYKYSQKDSLFNVILKFAEDTLLLVNDKPVCKYDKVLDWHELSMQLGEDLFTTALKAGYDVKHGRECSTFLWHPYTRTSHPALNELYRRPLTELHAHLKGTSLNFDLNWLSLMNFIQNRAQEFKVFDIRQHVQVTVGMEDYVNDLYHQVMKAAAIRLYLFATIMGQGDDVAEIVIDILRSQNRLEATFCCSSLQEAIDSYRQLYGKRYTGHASDYDIVDYTILKSSAIERDDLLVSVLSGERTFMYSLIKRCFEGNLSHLHEQLLIAYFVIKARLRQEMVQLNEGVGFDNFATYQDRKTAFIKVGSVYERLIAQFAIGNFLKESPKTRYMEARIIPKMTGDDVRCQIHRTDLDVRSEQFGGGEGWQYYFIYHFIKRADNTKDILQDLVPRHHALRGWVKLQAKAIYAYRNYNLSEGNDRVVGIDAASSEIKARPEVFAQAYRYLRRHRIDDHVMCRPQDLRMTYHVGEDFMDVVDGLRAYDEVVRFLQFCEGDRLGHGLVLGVDVATYYKRRNLLLALPIQMILDNIVWLYEECRSLGDPYILAPQLEREFEYYYRMLYGDKIPIYSMHTYYHSWLLRGDNPYCYQDPTEEPQPAVSVDEWEMNNLIVGDPDISNARKDGPARRLYSLYHFDRRTKANGRKVVEYHISEEYVNTVELIRRGKLADAEQRHLAIECNPTSNYKIGELTDYAEHPITQFYNEGISGGEDRHSLSVSINTDDAGVFSTSIEREYAVMSKALEEKYCKKGQLSPKQIYDWLEDVRQFGQQQMFGKWGSDRLVSMTEIR